MSENLKAYYYCDDIRISGTIIASTPTQALNMLRDKLAAEYGIVGKLLESDLRELYLGEPSVEIQVSFDEDSCGF
jgi:hypothetical protein